jgi:hypothetical protein
VGINPNKIISEQEGENRFVMGDYRRLKTTSEMDDYKRQKKASEMGNYRVQKTTPMGNYRRRRTLEMRDCSLKLCI